MAKINKPPFRSIIKGVLWPKEWTLWLTKAYSSINDFDTTITINIVSIALKANKVIGAVAGNLAGLDADGDLTDSGKVPPTGDIVGTTDIQTLTDKTLTQPTLTEPTIADFTNATHDHLSDAGGGDILDKVVCYENGIVCYENNIVTRT